MLARSRILAGPGGHKAHDGGARARAARLVHRGERVVHDGADVARAAVALPEVEAVRVGTAKEGLIYYGRGYHTVTAQG